MTGKKVCTGFSTDPTTVALVTWHTSVKTFFFSNIFDPGHGTHDPGNRPAWSVAASQLRQDTWLVVGFCL